MRYRHSAAWLLVLVALVGCPPPDKEEGGRDALSQLPVDYATKAEAQLRGSWSVYLAAHPDQLKRLLAEPPARGGWVKLYGRDYPAALAAFQGATTVGGKVGLGRVHLALAEFYQKVFDFALVAEQKYLDMWAENAGRVPRTAVYDFVEGEIAFHRGDLDAAIEALGRYQKAAGSEDRLVAIASVYRGVALAQKGDEAGAERAWSDSRIEKFPEAGWLLIGLTSGGGGQEGDGRFQEPADTGGLSTYARRNRAFAWAVRGRGDEAVADLSSMGGRAPDFEETVALAKGSVVRHYYDPLVLRTLAIVHAKKALQILADVPGAAVYRMRAGKVAGIRVKVEGEVPATIDAKTLPLFLFSDYPTPADMASSAAVLLGHAASDKGLLGTFESTLREVRSRQGEADRQGGTRVVVELAQKYVDIGRRLVRASGNEEGTRTILGLKTVDSDVARAVRRHAEGLQGRGRLLDALFLIEHVMEKDQDGFTYRNEPPLFVEASGVYVALGRYREAMNYFYRLVERYPELWMVQETLGNLSVLGTVDQAGRTGQQD